MYGIVSQRGIHIIGQTRLIFMYSYPTHESLFVRLRTIARDINKKKERAQIRLVGDRRKIEVLVRIK